MRSYRAGPGQGPGGRLVTGAELPATCHCLAGGRVGLLSRRPQAAAEEEAGGTGPDGEAASRPGKERPRRGPSERGRRDKRMCSPPGPTTSGQLVTVRGVGGQRPRTQSGWGLRARLAALGVCRRRREGGRMDPTALQPLRQDGRRDSGRLSASGFPGLPSPWPRATDHSENVAHVSPIGDNRGLKGWGRGDGGHSCRVMTRNYWASFSEVESVWRLVRD